MNDTDGMYIQRHAEAHFMKCLALFPCVAVTGPRQSGKSTMVRHVLPDVPYITFDDPEEELAFKTDPKGFIGRFKGRVIFDEVQRVPLLFRYLKMEIDDDPGRTGRYILTGSNQLTLQKSLGESLAGRIGLVSLLPFERLELPEPVRPDQILHGSYPTLATRNNTGAREWFSAYLATYLEKDVRLVFDIGKLSDFQLLVRLAAARTSQELNASSISRELGVSSNTVSTWISVLQASYIVFTLQPYHANIGKRLIKRPKLYFWDTGLASYLTGLRDMDALEGGPLAGPLFENLVIAELMKRSIHGGSEKEFWFYRDNAGNEVDLIVHDAGLRRVEFIEIKSGKTAKAEWAHQLLRSAEPLEHLFPGCAVSRSILYRGETKRDWPMQGCAFVNYEEALCGNPAT